MLLSALFFSPFLACVGHFLFSDLKTRPPAEFKPRVNTNLQSIFLFRIREKAKSEQ